jgi:hypothetical protein
VEGIIVFMPIISAIMMVYLVVVVTWAIRRGRHRGERPPARWEWNARLPAAVSGGGLPESGRFRFDRGRLVYLSGGSADPAWAQPYAQLTVHKLDPAAGGGADLELSWPEGNLCCAVSRERTSRTDDDVAILASHGWADEFISALTANGAKAS